LGTVEGYGSAEQRSDDGLEGLDGPNDPGLELRVMPSPETSSAVPVLDKRLPDFFIVGHPKCGTTALYEFLRRHPQIFMPQLKETRFFAPELHPRTQELSTYPTTLEQYLSLFDRAEPGQRVGEATPSYLVSRAAARRIAELRPDARIIAVLREPVSFLHSFHLQRARNRSVTTNDPGMALALEDTTGQVHESGDDAGFAYSDYVRYVEQLRRYQEVFPPEQIMVIIYDDYRRDNEAVIRDIWRFLGVDDTVPVRGGEVHPSVRIRAPRLYAIVHRIAKSLGFDTAEELIGRDPHEALDHGRANANGASQAVADGRSAGPAASSNAIKRLLPLSRSSAVALRNRLFYDKPKALDEDLVLELRQRFKPEVVALSEYLGRDLVALWGYDKLEQPQQGASRG
jgi:hypothetical protein